MARLTLPIDAAGTPEEVFDYLADFSTTAEWDPGVVEARRLDEGPLCVGSRFEVIVSFYGSRSRFEYELTAMERPHRFRVVGTNGLVTSDDDVAITPVAGGVRVTYDAKLSLPWFLALADPLLGLAFSLAGPASAEGMRRTLERRFRVG